jgi:RHS repeat-associated protein
MIVILRQLHGTTNSPCTGCSQESGFSANATANNQLSSLGYDAAGNTLNDGTYAYTWDGESQLTSAGGMTYLYDGDGRRAAKLSSGVPTKLYWYGPSDEILAETDGAGNVLSEYLYFKGRRINRFFGSTMEIYFEDSLGSSRVVTSSTGAVTYDADLYPLGGERAYTNASSNVYKFEGKERDTETGNDDFGARNYSNRFGRWLSADWSAIPAPVPYANLSNPQTLNLYAMVADDPESFADLDGHCCWDPVSNKWTAWFGSGEQAPPAQNTSTVILTNTTTVTSADGKTTTTTNTYTSLTFSTEKGHEGEFKGATQYSMTVVSSNGSSMPKITIGPDASISEKQAIGTVGTRAFNDARESALPSLATQFGGALRRDVVNHPFRTIGRAIALGALTVDPPTSLLGAGLMAAGAAADLGESVQHAREEE